MPLSTSLSAFTLSAAMSVGAAAMAADLPKEGTYSGTYSAFGEAKVTSIGKERVLLTISDENGMSLTNGFGDHVIWRCWGSGDYTNGVGQDSGYCVATDPSGDQFVDNWSDAKHELGGKIKGTDVFSSGTGKYTGITGGGTFEVDGRDFKMPEGTYAIHGPMQGNYKLLALTQ
jgi:hypothetical protein